MNKKFKTWISGESSRSQPTQQTEGTEGKKLKFASRNRPLDVLRSCIPGNKDTKKAAYEQQIEHRVEFLKQQIEHRVEFLDEQWKTFKDFMFMIDLKAWVGKDIKENATNKIGDLRNFCLEQRQEYRKAWQMQKANPPFTPDKWREELDKYLKTSYEMYTRMHTILADINLPDDHENNKKTCICVYLKYQQEKLDNILKEDFDTYLKGRGWPDQVASKGQIGTSYHTREQKSEQASSSETSEIIVEEKDKNESGSKSAIKRGKTRNQFDKLFGSDKEKATKLAGASSSQ